MHTFVPGPSGQSASDSEVGRVGGPACASMLMELGKVAFDNEAEPETQRREIDQSCPGPKLQGYSQVMVEISSSARNPTKNLQS